MCWQMERIQEMEINLVVDVCVMDRVPDVGKKLKRQYAQGQ